jgi:hypothetical protein
VEIHKRATALLNAPHINAKESPHDASKLLSGTDQNDQLPAPLPVEPFPLSTCCIKDTIGTRELCWTLRGKEDLAQLFQRHPVSIQRAVERGELPPPIMLLGQQF